MTGRNIPRDWVDTTVERRKWERHPPARGTLALLNGKVYRLMDISHGGFSIYDYGEEAVPEEMIVSLHCFDEGFSLDAIRCRKVSDLHVVSQTSRGDVVLNRIGLEILEKNPDLMKKLAPFMGSP